MSDPLLQVQSLTKSYGNLKVLNNITFELQRGEILGLVGRRGAGKTTLLHLIGGARRPTQGTISLLGDPVHFASTIQAREAGVELVYQPPQIVDQLDVIQNVFLGHEVKKVPLAGLPNWERMHAIAKDLLAVFDLPENLINEPVINLSDEQRHLVALMRAFSKPPRLLLLDDILPNLSYHRQEILLEHVREQAQQGLGVIVCSDNLKHLFNITDRILVFFQGCLVADRLTSDCTPRDIVELIVGASHQEQITPVIWALESYHKAQKQTEELFQEQAKLQQNLQASDLLNRQLIERLSNRVKAMDRLNAALQETQRRLMTEREEERRALARELHDSVIQDLLGLNYLLEDVEDVENSDEQRNNLSAVREAIRQVVGDLRQLCRDLRPPTIDNHGLSSAIPSLAQEWEERTSIPVKVEIDPLLGRLPELVELSIFRIVQESLGNVSKHANAREVQLTIERTPAGYLSIRFADDGEGIEILPDLANLSSQHHFGLVGISERVALLDGSMQIESSSGQGFALQIELPNPNPFG
jgi:signal transduction histidine kinase